MLRYTKTNKNDAWNVRSFDHCWKAIADHNQLVNLALTREVENHAMEDKVAMEVVKRGTRIHLSTSNTGRLRI